MEMSLQALEAKRDKLAKWGKYGALGLVAFLLAPFLWIALGGIVAAIIGLVLVNIAPWISMKAANWKYKAIIAEAKKNPIPTLLVQYEKDGKEIEEIAAAVLDQATEVENVRSKIVDMKAAFPAEAKQFEADLRMMEESLDLNHKDLEQLRADHRQFYNEIKKAQVIWDVSNAINKANAKLNRAENALDRIKRETALEAVQASMNRSRAQLRMRLSEQRTGAPAAASAPALENNPTGDDAYKYVTNIRSVQVDEDTRVTTTQRRRIS